MGSRTLTVEAWREILVHEISHIVHGDAQDTDPFDKYKGEFRARWVSPRFAGIEAPEARAEACKKDVLGFYCELAKAYAKDPELKKTIDAHRQPDEGDNLTKRSARPSIATPRPRCPRAAGIGEQRVITNTRRGAFRSQAGRSIEPSLRRAKRPAPRGCTGSSEGHFQPPNPVRR